MYIYTSCTQAEKATTRASTFGFSDTQNNAKKPKELALHHHPEIKIIRT
ncbi:MAG TPA: hypothetical protein VIN73_06990 [Vicingaceae bacterium]